jgi:hypothetical protein
MIVDTKCTSSTALLCCYCACHCIMLCLAGPACGVRRRSEYLSIKRSASGCKRCCKTGKQRSTSQSSSMMSTSSTLRTAVGYHCRRHRQAGGQVAAAAQPAASAALAEHSAAARHPVATAHRDGWPGVAAVGAAAVAADMAMMRARVLHLPCMAGGATAVAEVAAIAAAGAPAANWAGRVLQQRQQLSSSSNKKSRSRSLSGRARLRRVRWRKASLVTRGRLRLVVLQAQQHQAASSSSGHALQCGGALGRAHTHARPGRQASVGAAARRRAGAVAAAGRLGATGAVAASAR